MPKDLLYEFRIETTTGTFVHAEIESMDNDQADDGLDFIWHCIDAGSVMHVRDAFDRRRLDSRPWTARRFNPAHVVNVYYLEAR